MREDCFYWKCDCDISTEDKKRLYLSSKYDDPGIPDAARKLAEEFFGCRPDIFRPFGGDGNHYAFLSRYKERKIFIRTDDGLQDDDYMLAETALMSLASQAGVPVPQVWRVDVSRQKFPFRYQVMEQIEYPSLNRWNESGELDKMSIAVESGRVLAKLHKVELPGYGFINTGHLAATGKLRGLDRALPDYFVKRLDRHLGYLEKNRVLDADCLELIRIVIDKGLAMLNAVPGRLVHRDFAFWNILGTTQHIVSVIDWDDAVSGDPADDFGIMACFHEADFIDAALAEYSKTHVVDGCFLTRIQLHLLRNMLWKTVIRHRLGYFDQGEGFFLNKNDLGMPMFEYTLYKINGALKRLEKEL